jgi:ferredoxin
MDVRIDAEACMGHGRCYATVPEVFDLDDEGRAELLMITVPPELLRQVQLAVSSCPERAISLIDTPPS